VTERDYCGEALAAAGIQLNGGGENNQAPRIEWSERVFTAASLQHMTFPPLKFILPGLVPEGASLLVSRPKLGKSWLVLDIAIATAAERFTLGQLKPSSGDVLYLALEDGPRRLQRRITKLLPVFSGSWPAPLMIATEWPRADQGGLSDIEQWIGSARHPRLVIIDTLAQFRRVSNGKTQIYADDYAAISELQKLASKYNIAVVIVHHDRKGDAEDVFDTVSGSLGLTGAADTILIMKRQAGMVSLHVRGRDIEEAEKALQFDRRSCRWTIVGEAVDVRRSDERGRVLAALREAGQPMATKDILLAAELKNRNAADQLIFRMVKDCEIERAGPGRYFLPDAGASKDESNNQNKIDKTVRPESQPIEITGKSVPDDLTASLTLTDLTGLTANGGLGPPGDSLDDFR
jgi:RecA-family ATPase